MLGEGVLWGWGLGVWRRKRIEFFKGLFLFGVGRGFFIEGVGGLFSERDRDRDI